uniref:DDE Tnp4 domain-containing protein n=1 Tax=Heligmosomoides polygyrus TaxID=6339 RepID=A0A183F823_HELPZ
LKLGRTTVQNIVYEGCRAIIEEFYDEAFPPPSRATWRESAEQFRSIRKYPRGVGSMDGRHFRCFAPRCSGSSYYNYKGFFSLVLLAVVNGAYRILALDLGGKGGESDPFLESSVGIFPAGGDLDGEGVVDYHILADGGFAQTTWMQRPFRQAEVCSDPLKARFNECFSSARRIVESVFGIICARFRIFQRPLIGTEEHCKLLIAAALMSFVITIYMYINQLFQRYASMGGEVVREPFSRARARFEAQAQRMRMVNYFARQDELI